MTEETKRDAGSNDVLDISNTNSLDLSGMEDHAKNEIKKKYAEGEVRVREKAEEASVDIQATDATLQSFNKATREATQDGNSITMTHTQSTSVGRTEIVMGNTEKAAAGRIARSGVLTS
jgi:hypothetical protein